MSIHYKQNRHFSYAKLFKNYLTSKPSVKKYKLLFLNMAELNSKKIKWVNWKV